MRIWEFSKILTWENLLDNLKVKIQISDWLRFPYMNEGVSLKGEEAPSFLRWNLINMDQKWAAIAKIIQSSFPNNLIWAYAYGSGVFEQS